MTKKEEEEKEIPSLCMQTFVTRAKALGVAWILAGVLFSLAGTAIGWALSANTSIANNTTEVANLKSNEVVALMSIERKMDILLNKVK